jgi:hypothetical protein
VLETKAKGWTIFPIQVLGQISVMAGALGLSLLALKRIDVPLGRPFLILFSGLALMGVVGYLQKQYRDVSISAIIYGLSGCLIAGATHVLATGSVLAIAAILIASLALGFLRFHSGPQRKRLAKKVKPQ